MKTAIVVLSDPKAGEEALGRLFNALAAAHDFKQHRHDVRVLFQGAGTRWPVLVTRPDHPAHALYMAVKDRIAGVSSACADVFGARAGAEACALPMLQDNAVPGTSGLPSLERLCREGFTVLTF